MTTDSQTIIELNNISHFFGDESTIKNISLKVQKGDYLGVIGPNGGGKTTLLKIILGLIKPKEGEVKLFGEDINKFKDWSKIGYVSQRVSTYLENNFPATVGEVVEMGRYAQIGLLKPLTNIDKQKVDQALKRVGMSEQKEKLIGDLSGGQKQRVFIARALVSDPEVILLDEPTVGVDLRSQEQFYSLLQDLNKELNLTLVLVSHDIDVVTNEVTELVCLNHEMVYHGTPKQFIKEDYIQKLYGKGVKFILHDH